MSSNNRKGLWLKKCRERTAPTSLHIIGNVLHPFWEVGRNGGTNSPRGPTIGRPQYLESLFKSFTRLFLFIQIYVFNIFSHLQANKLLLSVFQKLTVNHVYKGGSYLICHKHGANEFVIRKESCSPSSKM